MYPQSLVEEWPTWLKLLVIFIICFFTALYVLSPIDLIPDIIPIIGWLDDLGAILLAWRGVHVVYPHRVPEPPDTMGFFNERG